MRRLPALITVGAAGRRRPGGPVRGRRRRGRRVRRHVRGDRRRDGRLPVAVVRPGDRAHVGAVVGEPGRRRSLRSLGDGRAVVVRVRVRRAGCRVGIGRLRRLGRLVRLGRLRRLGRARPGGRVGAIRAHRDGLPGSGNGSRQAMSGRLGGTSARRPRRRPSQTGRSRRAPRRCSWFDAWVGVLRLRCDRCRAPTETTTVRLPLGLRSGLPAICA